MNSAAALELVKKLQRPLTSLVAGSGACYVMYQVTSPTELSDELVGNQVLKRQLYEPKLPYPLWDYNWDGKEPPTPTTTTNDNTNKTNTNNTKNKPTLHQFPKEVRGVTRHLLLVRHGQYEEIPGHNGDDKDHLRVLTPLGRQQAIRTGQRLARFQSANPDCRIKVIRSSDMARAKETAELMAREINMEKETGESVSSSSSSSPTSSSPSTLQVLPDRRLNEAIPAPIVPPFSDSMDEMTVKEIDDNRGRLERAFHNHIYRGKSDPETSSHEFEVIVCHGNLIRYFLCRALQLPPEAWLRMTVFNCGITYLVIRPNGIVAARTVGEIGHLDDDQTSCSTNRGFAW